MKIVAVLVAIATLALAVAHVPRPQMHLINLSHVHLLLDGTLAYEPKNSNLTRLPEPISPILCLLVVARIPIDVEDNHFVRCR